MEDRLKRFVLAALAVATFSASAFARALAQTPPPDFGQAPSGDVPILLNDQHVYAKPDKLQAGRVLAAVVRGTTIVVPLRSMFEQMGATVTYTAATKTVDVSKPGVDIRVTVGKREVVLNGESRPLDVPAEIDDGTVVVPVRVISESLGAYVLWVAEKHLVVVRYVAAAPAATPPPPPPPSATPMPTATPAPPAPSAILTPTPPEAPRVGYFLAGDGIFDPKVYNAFVPGTSGGTSVAARAGATVPVSTLSVLAEATYAEYRGRHGGFAGFDTALPCGGIIQPPAGNPSCVTILGPAKGTAYVAPFALTDTDVDGRIGVGITGPYPLYVVASYERRSGNYGYPVLQGIGAGIEKVPNFNQLVDLYGSMLYYPGLSGNYLGISGNSQTLSYRYLKYQAGLVISPQTLPIFIEAGFTGNRADAKTNAPIGTSEAGTYAGIGLHF